MDFRSSCPEVFCKIAALRNFAKFTGKHLCQSLFFNKVAGSGSFHENFGKFLRTPFLTEYLQWLLLVYLRFKQLSVFIEGWQFYIPSNILSIAIFGESLEQPFHHFLLPCTRFISRRNSFPRISQYHEDEVQALTHVISRNQIKIIINIDSKYPNWL